MTYPMNFPTDLMVRNYKGLDWYAVHLPCAVHFVQATSRKDAIEAARLDGWLSSADVKIAYANKA